MVYLCKLTSVNASLAASLGRSKPVLTGAKGELLLIIVGSHHDHMVIT